MLSTWYVLSTALLIAVFRWQTPLLWPLAFSIPLIILMKQDRDLRELVFYPLYGLRGERDVATVLDNLDDSYCVIHDLDIGRGNVDHVVIGPGGAFAIETKAWTGRVWLQKGPRLMTGRRDETRAIRQAERNAIAVRTKAQTELPWVEAVIVLSRGRLPKGRVTLKRVSVIEAADLPRFIEQRRTKLTSDAIDRAFNRLCEGQQAVVQIHTGDE